jgi:hypothetical protein
MEVGRLFLCGPVHCVAISRALFLSLLLFLLSLLSLYNPFCGLTFLLLVASRLFIPFLAYTFLYDVPRSRSTILSFISPEDSVVLRVWELRQSQRQGP